MPSRESEQLPDSTLPLAKEEPLAKLETVEEEEDLVSSADFERTSPDSAEEPPHVSPNRAEEVHVPAEAEALQEAKEAEIKASDSAARAELTEQAAAQSGSNLAQAEAHALRRIASELGARAVNAQQRVEAARARIEHVRQSGPRAASQTRHAYQRRSGSKGKGKREASEGRQPSRNTRARRESQPWLYHRESTDQGEEPPEEEEPRGGVPKVHHSPEELEAFQYQFAHEGWKPAGPLTSTFRIPRELPNSQDRTNRKLRQLVDRGVLPSGVPGLRSGLDHHRFYLDHDRPEIGYL